MVNQATEQDIVTRAASKLFKAMDWLVPVPTDASHQERRSYFIAAIGLPLALLSHFLFIFLFADVVDFTPMSAEMAPTELVELLNEVFSDFDVLSEKYGLEKSRQLATVTWSPPVCLNHALTMPRCWLKWRLTCRHRLMVTAIRTTNSRFASASIQDRWSPA